LNAKDAKYAKKTLEKSGCANPIQSLQLVCCSLASLAYLAYLAFNRFSA